MFNDRCLLAVELQSAFRRLDALIACGVARAKQQFAQEDPYRGLHIDAQEVQRLLEQPPGAPILTESSAQSLPLGSRLPTLHRLQDRLGLSAFDLDVVLIALAPEFDLRYERLYAYLQDDVTRRRPCVDLALNLLCSGIEDKLARRAHFLPDAPLVRHRIVELAADDAHPPGPVLARALQLDEQVVGWLLGRDRLHPLLQSSCRLLTPAADSADGVLTEPTQRALKALSREATAAGAALVVHVQGPNGVGKRCAALAIARERGCDVLEVDLTRQFSPPSEFDRSAALVAREAVMRQAVVLLRDFIGPSVTAAVDAAAALVARLVGQDSVVVVAGPAPWLAGERSAAAVVALHLEMPAFKARIAAWRTALDGAALQLSNSDIRTLGGRFRLTQGQVSRAVSHAHALARWRGAAQAVAGADSPRVQLDELMQAARAQAGAGLARLAHKRACRQRWADLALPSDAQAQLRELCDQVLHRATVFGDWGFERKLSLGKGISALFCGPPGTGKTMAAEVLAAELGLDLYKIDLSRIVNKYIGETEKNLDSVFAAAEDANAILFFDEADALFGKRSEVKDAHDRYANIEVGYLLQKMEEHEGVAILATNLRHHLDDAFVRRMQAIVEFPFPDEQQRLRIWTLAFPAEAPLAPDVDLAALARDVRLAGGHIRNIALAAAFLAARDGSAIGPAHLAQAVRREHQKLGRGWSEPAASVAAEPRQREAA